MSDQTYCQPRSDITTFPNELNHPIAVTALDPHDAAREAAEQFTRGVFRRSYGATLQTLYPRLLAFSGDNRLRASVGVRSTVDGPLFAEQYLDAPAEALVATHFSQPVHRGQLVEVGNLAMASPGEARWLIAAVTAYLYGCGYRWVLFTAVRPLFNAFQRLGLNPVELAVADPARLPDTGRTWGSYYEQRPVVCIGDIRSGYDAVCGFASGGQRPLLEALLDGAFALGCPRYRHSVVVHEAAV